MNIPPFISVRQEFKDTLKLAGPIVLNQVGHMSMGLVDTMVAGHISTNALAGLGLAANFFWTFTSVCVGCLLALDTYFSQSIGARDETRLSRYFRQSFWSCALVTLASTLAILLAFWVYRSTTAPTASREAAEAYLRIIIWCVPSLFFYFVLQRYWQARHRVLPFTLIVVVANILNLAACLALGLGRWGFPRMGVEGLALATLFCRYAMLAAGLAFTWWHLRPASLKPSPIDWRVQREFFKLGLPAAGHTFLEVGAFGIATLVVSVLGPVSLAAHHICLMMAAFTFMFPVGFSSAAAVRVGLFIGAEQPARARLAGWLCIGVSISVMSLFAMGYLALPRFLLSIFTADPAVIELGIKILVLVALFQIADGIQVSTTGALRGLGNTRTAMLANLFGHYPIGLLLGLVLCFGFGFGAVGLWSGLAAGLVAVALILIRAWSRATRDPRRLQPLTAVAQPATEV
jgi:MATE family multidrug resistance protein